MANIEELFGSSVFNDAVMQKRLPKDIYKALHKTITDGTPLDPQVANVVANAMKDWRWNAALRIIRTGSSP